MHQFDMTIYVLGCHQQTTARFIYKMRPLSNLSTNNKYIIMSSLAQKIL